MTDVESVRLIAYSDKPGHVERVAEACPLVDVLFESHQPRELVDEWCYALLSIYGK